MGVLVVHTYTRPRKMENVRPTGHVRIIIPWDRFLATKRP